MTSLWMTIPLSDSVEPFWEGAQLNLIDCDVDKNGYFIPKHIVLEPDYLIDASAIAECFQDYAVSPLHYFRNKLEEKENRSYILLGNLANFFLDELVYAEDPDDVSFDDVFCGLSNNRLLNIPAVGICFPTMISGSLCKRPKVSLNTSGVSYGMIFQNEESMYIIAPWNLRSLVRNSGSRGGSICCICIPTTTMRRLWN